MTFMQFQICKTVLPEFHVVHVVKSHVVNVVSGKLLVQIYFRLFITRFLLEINKFWSDLLAKLYHLLKLHLNLNTEKRRDGLAKLCRISAFCLRSQLACQEISLHSQLGSFSRIYEWIWELTNHCESMTLIIIYWKKEWPMTLSLWP